ncbi:MAG: ATP-binding protein [Prevotella sp.]
MTNESTINKLIEMRLTTMADSFRIQKDDVSMKDVPFDDRFGMLVDAEYTSRKNNRLKRLIKRAEFEQPDASIAAIDYRSGRKLNKDLIERLATCEYITEYRNYRSGQAKKNFLADLQKAKDAKLGAKVSVEEAAAFKHAQADAIVAPVKGQIFWEFQGDGETAPAVEPYIGKEYKEGEAFCWIQAPWGEFVEVKADLGGKLVEINARQGGKVQKGSVIAYIQREHQN